MQYPPVFNPFVTRLVAVVLLGALLAVAGSAVSNRSAFGATSPILGASGSYSVLAGSTVTNTGPTITGGAVGVSPGTSITGFPPGSAGGGTHSNDASAIAAQADSLIVFGTLDQPCDQSFGAVDLTTTFPAGVGPGVYCSTSSFSLTGNLNLTGSGVWIFKTVSTLITSPGSSVTGGDPCNVWWRIGSSAVLGTTTSFRGNIFALTSITLQTSASLNGRALARTGQVSLDTNTVTAPICALGPTNTPLPAAATATQAAVATATQAAAATATQAAAATATQAAAATATQAAAAIATPIPFVIVPAAPRPNVGAILSGLRNNTAAAPSAPAPPSVPAATSPPQVQVAVQPPSTGDAGLFQPRDDN